MSDKIVFLRSISRFVLLVFLLLSMVWISFTKSIGHASLMNTPKASANNLTSLQSDVNGDGVVDILDLTAVAVAWNSRPQDPKWNPKLDLNADGVVSIVDMVLLLKDFGRSIGTEHGLMLVVYPHTFTDEEASFVASHFDVVDFDFDATIGFGKIRALNPNITMVGYRCFLTMATWQSDWNTVNQKESWFLHTKYGNTTQYRVMASDHLAYIMDFSNSGWRNYIASWCTSKLAANPTIDGILADNVAEAIVLYWKLFDVPITDLPADIVSNWNTYMIGMIQTVKAALGSKLLIINTPDLNGLFIQYCDGQVIEHFLHRSYNAPTDFSETDPAADFNLLEKLSATGKIVLISSGAAIPQNPTATDIEQIHQCMLYCLSGFLLGYSGKANFGWQSMHTDFTGHRGYWDEMGIRIGNPKGSEYQVTGNLYARDFDAARVFINVGSSGSYNVTYAGKNYTVGPHSGLIAT